jgi:hypothetical protein
MADFYDSIIDLLNDKTKRVGVTHSGLEFPYISTTEVYIDLSDDPVCECGSSKIGSPYHSSYCPMYGVSSPKETHVWTNFDNFRKSYTCTKCGLEIVYNSFGQMISHEPDNFPACV